MTFLNTVVAEFRQRRLWPVALLLLAALVGVPVLLSKSPASVPASVPAHPAPVAGSVVPVLSISTGASGTVGGSARDPFAGQAASPAAKPAAAAAVARTATALAAHAVTSVVNAASGGVTTSAKPSTTPVSPLSPVASLPSSAPTVSAPAPSASPAPASSPKAAPRNLGPRQSYHVSLSVSDNSGGVAALDPVQRLSILPSAAQPLVVELGVLQGGQKVLFAALPGTQPDGAGQCTPAPDDCQVFALAQDQVETLTVGSGTNATVAAELTVAGIAADRHATAAAGAKARNDFSAAGQKLLQNANLDAVSLFEYRPRIGALVDLSNLTVGN